jgi:ABC-type phosphate transport system substrate-binding protein
MFVKTSSPPEVSQLAKAVPWPVGIAAPGNEGVAGVIKGSPNTLGYALASNIPYALIQNAAGKWIAPSLNSTQAAVANSPVQVSIQKYFQDFPASRLALPAWGASVRCL